MATESPLCELSGVTRGFVLHGQPVEVLRGVDLVVAVGDTVAIRGASGAGKSTLLSVLGLVDLSYEGAYRFRGQDVAAAGDAQRTTWRLRDLGIAFQDLWLVESLTARENVLVPLYAAKARPLEADQRARDLLEAAGLGHALDHRPAEMSGGERRRVAVARALANRPRLLIVDEPTAELDADSSGRVLGLLRRALEEGAALVAASHDPSVIALCARRYRLRDGRLHPDA